MTILIWSLFASTPQVGVFFNIPSIGIVLGGTIGAMFVSFPMKDVTRSLRVAMDVFRQEDLPIDTYINQIVELSKQVFAKGTMKMGGALEGQENEFLKDGLQMLVDQRPIDKIREYLQASMQTMYDQGKGEAAVFKSLANYAPAFGLLGTLIGLIAMLQGLGAGGALETIGTGMAVSLITTFYGVILANMIFLPIATKYDKRIEQRTVLMNVIMEGLTLLATRQPPDLVHDRLKAYLPMRKWGGVKSVAAEGQKAAPAGEAKGKAA
ncbi:MAG: MotA/TolQ/ExbB proton channel family protein [Nitrospirae bacterium]|nr:MotA/TolQ/ExbB proton channel family protein [Nitrospirota bacterium]